MNQMQIEGLSRWEQKLQLGIKPSQKPETLLVNMMVLGVVSFVLAVVMFAGDIVVFASISAKLTVIFSLFLLAAGAFYSWYNMLKVMKQIAKSVMDKEAKKYERSHIDQGEVVPIQSRLKEVMFNDKLYLKPDLKLDDLASHIGVPKYMLTQVLNEYMHINFYQFVNNYRLDDFKARLQADTNMDYTILAHAYDSGFQSKSSFNKVFKENFNITPSAYRRGLFSKEVA